MPDVQVIRSEKSICSLYMKLSITSQQSLNEFHFSRVVSSRHHMNIKYKQTDSRRQQLPVFVNTRFSSLLRSVRVCVLCVRPEKMVGWRMNEQDTLWVVVSILPLVSQCWSAMHNGSRSCEAIRSSNYSERGTDWLGNDVANFGIDACSTLSVLIMCP